MSAAQHTQGPWRVRVRPNGFSVVDPGGLIASVDCDLTPARQEANSRLIAAAPDLLDALVVLLDATEDSIGKRFRDRAKRAIAKATEA